MSFAALVPLRSSWRVSCTRSPTRRVVSSSTPSTHWHRARGSEQQTAVNRLVRNAFEADVLDPLVTKSWAMRFATQAACTVLKVDQIIMAKQAWPQAAREQERFFKLSFTSVFPRRPWP